MCCIIVANIFWAFARSPDERAFPNASISLFIGFELSLDAGEADVVVLSVEAVSISSCSSCAKSEFCALKRSFDSSALKRELKSVEPAADSVLSDPVSRENISSFDRLPEEEEAV